MGQALDELGPSGLPTVRPGVSGQDRKTSIGSGASSGGSSATSSAMRIAEHIETQCEHAYYALEAGSVLAELAAAEAPALAGDDLEAARTELAAVNSRRPTAQTETSRRSRI